MLSAGNPYEPVLITAGVHGSEWMTTLIALNFFEEVCESVVTKKELCGVSFHQLLSYRGIAVVPCLNPDGVQISINGAQSAGDYAETVSAICPGITDKWKANARGVDINHNFNAGWLTLHEAERAAGITSPSMARYGGEEPESEAETIAIANFCRRARPRHALALHSQGEEIFWKYGEAVPERADSMAKIFAAVSGYSLVENSGLYSHGGFKDWFIKELRRPAFTVEVGKGENPLPLNCFNEVYRSVRELLVLSAAL